MDQLNLNIRLKYVTLFSGLLITTIVAALFWYLAQPVSVLFSVIAAGAATTGLVYTAINSQFTSQMHVEQLQMHIEALRVKKLENALTFIEYSTSPQMIAAIDIGVALREEVKGKQLVEVKRILADSPEKKKSLIMILNYFERLGLIVRTGAADEEALRRYYDAAVKRYWHSFHSWIDDVRNELQDGAVFSETEFLANRWN